MSANNSTMDIKNVTATIIPSFFMSHIKHAIDLAPRGTSITAKIPCDIKFEINAYDGSMLAFTVPMIEFNMKMSYDKYMVCDITLDDPHFDEGYFNVDNYFEDLYVDDPFDVQIDGYSILDCINDLDKSKEKGLVVDCDDEEDDQDEVDEYCNEEYRKTLQKARIIGSLKNAIMEAARMKTMINELHKMIPHPLVLKCLETGLSFCACVKKDY